MTENIELSTNNNSIMRKIYYTAVVMLLTICSFNAGAQNNYSENYIQLSSKADREITPDEIYIQFQIKEEPGKGKATLAEREKEMIKALGEIKIDVKNDLTISDMESDLKKMFLRKDNILASKNYRLKVSTADKAAAAFKALNSLKISDVALEEMRISKGLREQVIKELMAEAGSKAKANAAILAGSVGGELGKCIYVNFYEPNTSVGYAPRVMYSKALMVNEDAAIEEEATGIEVRKTTLSVNITCRFEIK